MLSDDELPPLPESFTILSRLQSGTEEVVPLDVVREYGLACKRAAQHDDSALLRQALASLEWASELTQVALDYRPLHYTIAALKVRLGEQEKENGSR